MHTLTLSPEAAKRIQTLQTDARSRIYDFGAELVMRPDQKGVMAEMRRFEMETWQNLATTLIGLIGLGGNVCLEDERNFLGRNEWLTYGVNQSGHDGTWSINS